MSEFSIRTKTFRLGLKDYRALWLAEAGRLFVNPMGLLALCIWVGAPLLLSLDDLRSGHDLTHLCAPLLWPVVVLALAAASLGLRWRRYRRDPMMSGDRIMVLDSGAIRVIGHGFDVRQGWATVHRIRHGRHHVFIHMNSQHIYIVPRRALSPDDIGRLTDTVGAAIRAARAAPAALAPLAETPDARDLWRSHPYRLTFAVIHARIFRPLWAIVFCVLGAAILGLTVSVWREGIGRLADLTWIYAIVATLVLIVFSLLLSGLIVRAQKRSRGERETCFTRDYVRCTGPGFDSRVDWGNVHSVRRLGGIFVFRFGSGRFDVPTSAFATPAQATAFFTQAVAFWRAAEARR